MGLFNLGKKKEESCCCCGSNPADAEMENCCCNNVGDSLVSIKVLGSGCKSCHELYENTKEAVKNAVKLVNAARNANVPIIFSNDAHLLNIDNELKLF